MNLTLCFFAIFATESKSFCVLLINIKFDPASAKAIAHARPKPLPAPVTKEYFPFKLYFFKYLKYF